MAPPGDDDVEEWVALDNDSFVKTHDAPPPLPRPPARAGARTRALGLGSIVIALVAYAVAGLAGRTVRMVTAGPRCASSDASAVRIGLLGAAKVAPWGLLHPARRLPCDVKVVAVGARDVSRAARLARAWGISSHGDYASVLASREVEAVYIPLLNGLHFEYATHHCPIHSAPTSHPP